MFVDAFFGCGVLIMFDIFGCLPADSTINRMQHPAHSWIFDRHEKCLASHEVSFRFERLATSGQPPHLNDLQRMHPQDCHHGSWTGQPSGMLGAKSVFLLFSSHF